MKNIRASAIAGTSARFAAALSSLRSSSKRRHGNVLQALLFCTVILPAAVLAQKVNTDFDRDVDFTKYKTYAYQVCHRVENTLVDKRIVAELESRVAVEGLSRSEANPDVNVTYHSSTTQEFSIDTNTWGYGFGSGWYWGHGGGNYGRGGYLGGIGPISTTTTIRKYTRGTLVVDIWDARTKELVWRGTAIDTVSDNPQKNEKQLKKAMEKLFKKYPPEKSRKQ